jgi:aminoglycoside 6-adenylyltransferase
MFRKFAKKVAANFDFIYPQLDDDRMTAFLYRIKDLPQDAKEIY